MTNNLFSFFFATSLALETPRVTAGFAPLVKELAVWVIAE